MTEQEQRTAGALVYLAWCALTDTAPAPQALPPQAFPPLYVLCDKNDLLPTIWLPLSRLPEQSRPQGELWQRWTRAKDMAVRKNILLDCERMALYAWMEQAGIWHMSLKGILLKPLYPKELRTMADNDILFDAARREEVRGWFLARGYIQEDYAHERPEVIKDDVYYKPPVYNFEMHTMLYAAGENETFHRYYAEIRPRLRPVRGCELAFSAQDGYIYLLTHLYKHYRLAGTGLRSLLDLSVYLRANPQMDRQATASACRALGLEAFEEQIRPLALRFCAAAAPRLETLPAEERQMLLYMMNAGTYGNQEGLVENDLEKLRRQGGHTTGRYLRGRLFPPYDTLCLRYPWLRGRRWLLPAAYLMRLLKSITTPRIWKELGIVRRSGRP